MVDGDTLAVEQFMQVYYRWMKTLSQLNELLIEVFEHRLLMRRLRHSRD
ncbi:MAG: hypothetical protein CM15mP92_1700 [Halieaceae bacterium]|nr:MAG: hypothetical protein CM15mP92_1700 [Halieaceae bacterium]